MCPQKTIENCHFCQFFSLLAEIFISTVQFFQNEFYTLRPFCKKSGSYIENLIFIDFLPKKQILPNPSLLWGPCPCPGPYNPDLSRKKFKWSRKES